MNKIKVTFYNNVDDRLKPYIKHYFVTHGELDKSENLQILPMDHYDIFVPVKGELYYVFNDHKLLIDSAIAQGIRHQNITVVQNGHLKAWGISFTSWGFHAYYKSNMTKLADRILRLSDCIPELDKVIESVKDLSITQIIESLESYFISNLPDKSECDLIELFIEEELTVGDFCNKYNIQRRSFERRFSKIVGVSPKDFKGIRKFEKSSRFLLYDELKLSEVALDSDYFDQAHFSKSFKKYSSYTPKEFVKDKPALKSTIDFE